MTGIPFESRLSVETFLKDVVFCPLHANPRERLTAILQSLSDILIKNQVLFKIKNVLLR